MRYTVHLVRAATETIDVEADDRQAAVEAAYEESTGGLCHQCAHHLDLGDVSDEIVTDAATGAEIPRHPMTDRH